MGQTRFSAASHAYSYIYGHAQKVMFSSLDIVMARVVGAVLVGLALFAIGIQAVNLKQLLTSQQLQGSSDAYINSWAAKIRGGSAVADVVALQNGFDNLGLVCGECLN